ncbi:MAG: hypothetical protein QGD91_13250, partial [Actinomycetota bacterium]|nr:hypothetical protein [Actinomycetota bacterium]
MMSSRLVGLVVASALGVGACTTTGSTPATTPPITAPPATTTSTPVPSTTSVVETTTTLDRVAEIQAIFQELEVRRLQAI